MRKRKRRDLRYGKKENTDFGGEEKKEKMKRHSDAILVSPRK